MNAMQAAVSSAVKNPIVSSKSPRRESRKQAVPVVQAPAAAPVVATPKPQAEKVQKPEVTFTISDRAALLASPWGLKLEARKTDEKIHLNHTAYVLQALLSSGAKSWTLSTIISALDRPAFEGAKPKTDKLLRAYVADCVETLVSKVPAGISRS